MTRPLSEEDKYVLSPENVEVAREMARAYIADDLEKMRELAKKLILPLSRLKFHGKEHVLKYGLPTITAEIANDTDWLK